MQAVAAVAGVGSQADADLWNGRATTRRAAEGSVEAFCDDPYCIVHGAGTRACPLPGSSTTTTFASLEVSPTVTEEYI